VISATAYRDRVHDLVFEATAFPPITNRIAEAR
jgi:hypothetical protein